MSAQQYDQWSLSLGRWGSLTVRLHIVYLLFAVYTLHLGWKHGADTDAANPFWIAPLAIALLTVGVLLHELGHFFMIRRLGGSCDSIVLWPFGGVASPRAWTTPRNGLFAVLAGPATSLLVCLFCLVLLVLTDKGADLNLLDPFHPLGLIESPTLAEILEFSVWINWLLFLVNLIPAFPFDGGQALYYFLAALWPELEHRQLRTVTCWTGRAFAVGLLLLACFASGASVSGDNPVWVPLSLLAIFVFFSAGQRGLTAPAKPSAPADSETPGEPDRDEEASLVDLRGPLARWIDERREAARQRREQVEADEEQRVDAILAQLHESGLDSLSRDDRALLKRVSARYRDRESSR